MRHAASLRKILGLSALVCASFALAGELVPKAPPDAMKLTAQDYAEIQQLAIRYAWLLDQCVNGGYDYADLYVGYGLTHIVTNHMIVPTKDGAVGKHRLITVGVCGYPHLIELQGGYEDEYVKTKEGWKFKSRTHVFKQATSLQFGVCAKRD